MQSGFLDQLAKRRLLGDGAMGTELMKLGLTPGACPEQWNQTHPDSVRAVTASYVVAGADFVHTNTLGANRWNLEHYGLAGSLAGINAAGVRLAREAAIGKALVVAEIGPTGRYMEPLGADPRSAFVDVFAEQAAAVAEAGADAILLETFASLDEALGAVEAGRKTGLPVIASMAYSRTAAGDYRTIMGNDAASCAGALAAAGASVISANCSMGPDGYAPLAHEFCSISSLPVMIQPNAGMPQLIGGRTIFPMSPSDFASHMAGILAAGVRIIGGCCGTTPDHIRALRRLIDGR
jgi:5-methyltetrahydrofolate--homocysteine methyltransferase